MIILLYGPDTFRAQQKLEEIIKQQKSIQKQGISFRRFFEEDINFQEFKDEVRQISMFKEKKLIIVENIFSNENFKESFMVEKEKFLESDNIIVFFEKNKILAKDILLKFLIKKTKVQQFDFLEGEKIRDWIRSEFQKYNASISPKALGQLTEFVGKDLWRMNQEIKKLVAYKNPLAITQRTLSLAVAQEKKGKQIEWEDVVLLVRPKIELDIFKTIDAVAEKRKGLAFHLLHRHLFMGESPLYLLTMVNYQFRNLLVVKDLIEKNNPFQLILKKSGLNPFVAKKSYQLAQKFTFSELKKIYRKIFQIDLDIKTGKMDAITALDLLIADM